MGRHVGLEGVKIKNAEHRRYPHSFPRLMREASSYLIGNSEPWDASLMLGYSSKSGTV